MRSKRNGEGEGVLAEFEAVCLGDARLDERLKRIVSLAAVAPKNSFPDQMVTTADREALYRFFANPKVTMKRVLAGHVEQTQRRIAERGHVRILHDTTEFSFEGEREGLGILQKDTKGFLGHFALAVSADETREPLGVLGVRPYIHRHALAHRALTASQRTQATRAKARQDRESSRWEGLALEVSAALPPGVRAVHVMDQEADDYDVMAALHLKDLAFVIRADPGRKTAERALCLTEVLAQRPAQLLRTVRINPRGKSKARGRYQARSERMVHVQIRWSPVTLRRTEYSQTDLKQILLWAVHVFEEQTPAGEQPIEWMLLSSEPLETLADASAVVDHYRSRWLIEEYFKALKTGCSFEKRQLTTYDSLTRALGLFIPMAWRLLVLRHLSRTDERPARSVFDDEQLLLLKRLLVKRRYSLPPNPTLRDAMFGIAALGGHIKNNGDPGWMVLGRGFIRFVDAEEVWCLARAAM